MQIFCDSFLKVWVDSRVPCVPLLPPPANLFFPSLRRPVCRVWVWLRNAWALGCRVLGWFQGRDRLQTRFGPAMPPSRVDRGPSFMMLLRTMCSNSMPCWNNIYFPSQLSPTEPCYQPEEARHDTFPAEIGRGMSNVMDGEHVWCAGTAEVDNNRPGGLLQSTHNDIVAFFKFRGLTEPGVLAVGTL